MNSDIAIQLREKSEMRVSQWYLIDGQPLYITFLEVRCSPPSLSLEGIRPEDYAAYVLYWYIGEEKPPYRTIAEIEEIPMPERVALTLPLNAPVRAISKEEALKQKKSDEQEAGDIHG